MAFGFRDAGTVSNRVCREVSLESDSRLLDAYLIHASNVGVVSGGIILHRDENAVTLCWTDINQICLGSVGVDAVNFHDPHSMAFEPEVLTCKSAYVDDAEHVSLPRLDGRCEIVRVIHEGRFWYWLGSRWIGHTDETFHERWYLFVVPI